MIRTMLACAAVGAFIIATVPNAAIAADMPASYKPTKAKNAVSKKAAMNMHNKSRGYLIQQSRDCVYWSTERPPIHCLYSPGMRYRTN